MTTITPDQNHGANLIREIREAALRQSTELKPITLVGVPRWAALWLGRARARELGKPLNQAHAESLREDANRQTPHALLWLPCDGHPNGGLFVFCHRGYAAGVLIGWRNYRPIGFPRTFSEYPDALCPWRSDQERWIKNETVARKEYNGLLREVSKLTRTQPAFVQPCEPLMAIIQGAAKAVVEAPQEYVVGLPDTQGGMCWLAGYESDPARYYTAECALRFKSEDEAQAAIVQAKETHPGYERAYRVIPASEMSNYNQAATEPAKMGPPTLVSTWEELAAIPPSATHRLEIEPEHGRGWIKSIEEPRGTDSDLGTYLSTHTFYGSNYEGMTRKLQECGFNVQLANWDAETQTPAEELP